MTCIVAATDGEQVVIGGDSAGSMGTELRSRADPKVFENGPYVFGFTSSFRMGQLLRYAKELPAPPSDAEPDDLHRFFVTDFVDSIRQLFGDKGFARKARYSDPKSPGVTEEGQEVGGLFLVGVAGQIFEVHKDFQIALPVAPYSAIGHGALLALGALHAMESQEDLALRERVETALEAAETYCTTVRRPFRFVSSP